MQLPNPRQRRSADNIVALINIVFLLLLFFMIAGTMASPQSFDVKLPGSQVETGQPSRGHVVYVGLGRQLAVGPRKIDLNGLKAWAEALVRTDPKASVAVRADRQVRAQRLMDVLETLSASGIARLDLVTVAAR